MDPQRGHPEEDGPPSKGSLWGDHVGPTKPQRIHQRPESPGTSCVSMKSDWSIDRPIRFKSEPPSADHRVPQQNFEVPGGPSAEQHQTDLDSILKLLEGDVISFVKNELKKIQTVLSPDYPEYSESQREDEEERSSREAFLKIAVLLLRRMKQEDLAERLHSRTFAAVCQRELKSTLKKRFQSVFEGVAKEGNSTPLNEIFTELHITEGGSEVNNEHEVMQIEAAYRKPHRPETTIRCEDVFKAPPGREEPSRTVMTKGVAGIGKTVLTQKVTLDWAEDKANQDIHFLFPFTFRQLNVMKEQKCSLVELIHQFFPETKDSGICRFEKFKVIFIFDGLDECRLPLDFHNNETLTDVTESSSVDVLLTNLIRGNLLPSARLWITTRPAAANQIPAECVGMVTEVRGFTDPQKKQYFRKRFRKEEQFNGIFSHIKKSRSLHIMCHIPVFCWITATVLEDLLKTREGGELPKTLTEMYIHFLVVQSKVKNVKYHGKSGTDLHWSPESKEMIESLGKLAFEQLQKGNLIFYESDLTECGIDIRAASVYSGVFTQVFREERGLYQDQVFCFVHLSVQEFLAALHVHLTFIKSGINLLSEEHSASWWSIVVRTKAKSTHLHQSAVEKALQSPNGHLDLLLRFLLGLSLQTNQNLLQGLLTQTGTSSETHQETVRFIKKKISEDQSPERSINLLHCLNELNDGSLVEEVQQFLRSGGFSSDKLSPAQWSALVFILLSSEEDLDVFDLKKYSASEEALQRLLPVVKASRKAQLSGCNLSERSCAALSSIFSSQSSSLTELDLSNNDLKDSGVKLLSEGLENQNSVLKALRLSGCNLSERSCAALSSVLSSHSSSLTELDLSNNDLKDSGVKLLSEGLRNQNCVLKALRLIGCNLSKRSYAALSSVLSSQSSSLTELDLSNNDLKDSGVKLLSEGLENQNCALKALRLNGCNLSKRSCAALSSVLSSQSSSLTELDLSNNNLKDSGVKLLSEGLRNQNCVLKALRLIGCNLSKRSCAALSSVLSSQSSSLTELDLSNNDLKDSGVKLLSGGLENQNCKLKALRLWGCQVSEEGCVALASALSSNPSHLRELDLSYNHPGDSGARMLSAGLDSLKMDHGGQQRLKSGLRKWSSKLKVDTNTVSRKLELSDNNRTVTLVNKQQPYPEHPLRFTNCPQLLCRDGLKGRCYWEVEWRGNVRVAVSYGGIRRTGSIQDCVFGRNDQSWSLKCSRDGYSARHNDKETTIPSSSSSSSSSSSGRVGVYLDWPAGFLSFYRVSSDSLVHLHTFRTTFTEPLFPGFWLWSSGSSMSLQDEDEDKAEDEKMKMKVKMKMKLKSSSFEG